MKKLNETRERVGEGDFEKYRNRRVVYMFCLKSGIPFYVKGSFAEFEKDLYTAINEKDPRRPSGYRTTKAGRRFLEEDGAYVVVVDSIPYKRSPHENARIAALAGKYREKYDNPEMMGSKSFRKTAQDPPREFKGEKVDVKDLHRYAGKRVVFAFCKPDHSFIHIGYAGNLERMVRRHLESPHENQKSSSPGSVFLSTPGSYIAILHEEFKKDDNAQQVRLKGIRDRIRSESEIPKTKIPNFNENAAKSQERLLKAIAGVIGRKDFKQAHLIDKVREGFGSDECWGDLERLIGAVRDMMEWLVAKYPDKYIFRAQLKTIKKLSHAVK